MRDDAARIWAFRARAELDAAARFERLATRLAGAGADATVVRMARSSASDEARHAVLCADLVRHFGSEPSQQAVIDVPNVAPSGLLAREQILYEVVALSCITETLSAALLGAMIEQARDVRVRETVHSILRDEVLHARLGWAHLAFESPRGYGRMLGDYLPAMLEGTVTAELFEEDDAVSMKEDSLAGVGALTRRDRKAIFVAAMRGVVFPGLERFGVDTRAGSIWLGDRCGQVSGSR